MYQALYLGGASVLVILVISIIRSSIRPANFPPGPPCLPFVGYLPFLDVRNVGRSFRLLSHKYGDIFSIVVGTKPLVVLNSYPLIKEAMTREEFSGRPDMFSGTFFQKGKTGICTTEGENWLVQRDFFQGQMRHFSLGKGFREVVMDEIDDLKADLAKKIGEPVELGYPINVSIINILWVMASGRKLHELQQEFQAVYECIDRITTFMSRAVIMSFVPLLSKILPERITKMERGRYHRDRFIAISKKWIAEHRDRYRGNRTGDLQDAYLDRIDQGVRGFDESELGAMLRELFVIGVESQSVMLRWSVRLLSVNKECQTKMQDELDRVVGDRSVDWDDRKGLHYTLAVMAELQRFGDIAPSGIPHKAICNVDFHGFVLPKGTSILSNLNACHRDPTYWKHPDRFYPEHFLDCDGQFISDKEGFVPFGTGLRRCPAEEMAGMTLFLMVANLFRSFAFCMPPGDDGTTGTYYEAGTSFVRNPKPFLVVVHRRQ